MKPVDLVQSQLDEVEQRREQAWAALKKMHDEANGIFTLTAAGGWCSPSSAMYIDGEVVADKGLLSLPEVTTARVPLRDKIQMTTVRG